MNALRRLEQGGFRFSLSAGGRITWRNTRRDDAPDETLVEIEALPIQMVAVTRARVPAAAHLKANHRISCPDSFAAAPAREYGATLVTGDPEFRAPAPSLAIEWLGS